MGSSLVVQFVFLVVLLVSITKVHADDGAASMSHVQYFRVQPYRQKMIFNVKKYGGVADGKTDNSKVILG